MLLKIGGCELEIVQGKFVCLGQNNGQTSHFSEWRHLGPKLEGRFKAIRDELLQVMENFIDSEDKTAFEEISEEYKNDQPDCVVPKI